MFTMTLLDTEPLARVHATAATAAARATAASAGMPSQSQSQSQLQSQSPAAVVAGSGGSGGCDVARAPPPPAPQEPHQLRSLRLASPVLAHLTVWRVPPGAQSEYAEGAVFRVTALEVAPGAGGGNGDGGCVGAGAVYALGLLRRALIVHSWSAVCSQTDDLFLLAVTFSVAAVTLRLRRRAFERHLPLSWIQLQLHLWLSLGGRNRERRHGDWRWHTSVVLVGREVHIKSHHDAERAFPTPN
jgi:hypothetical protein